MRILRRSGRQGLSTSERIDAVEDLEALKLDGLQQYKLLDQHLEDNLLSGDSPDWCWSLQGQGVLPAAAGADLAANQLRRRLAELQQRMQELGEPHREGSVLFAGDVHVVVEPGAFRPRALMRCWLEHLLLSAQGEPFDDIADHRRNAEGEVRLRWKPLDAQTADAELAKLQRLAYAGCSNAGPCPPERLGSDGEGSANRQWC